MSVERTELLRRVAEKFYSKYLETHAIVPFGSTFRSGRAYSEDAKNHAPSSTLPKSDVDIMLVSFAPKAKQRIIKEPIEGIEVFAIELPYSMFISWFSPRYRKAEYVRLLPLTTDLGFVQGKNAEKIRKVLTEANIQSTKLALERFLYENPGAKIVTPMQLAKIIMKYLAPASLKVKEPQYYRRHHFVRQVANNIEDALEAGKLAKRIEAKGKLRKAGAKFEITADLKPKAHRFKGLRADWEFLFGKGWLKELRPKRRFELWLQMDYRLKPMKRAAIWLSLPARIVKTLVQRRKR